MNKDISGGYWDCNKGPDNAKHALFNSPKLKNRVGEALKPQNIVDKIIRYEEESWKYARKLQKPDKPRKENRK